MRGTAAAIAALLPFAPFALAACESILGAHFDDATLGADAASDAGMIIDAVAPIDAEGGAPAIVPPADAGPLGLWLAADDGVVEEDAGVLVWHDRSGAGHDATQPIAALQPRRVAGDPPRIAFERARATCLDVSWPGVEVGTPMTIFVVTGGPSSSLVRFDGPSARVAFPIQQPDVPDAAPESRLVIDLLPATVHLRTGHAADPLELLTARIDPDVLGGVSTFRDDNPVERGSLVTEGAPPRTVSPTIGCAADGTDASDAQVGEIIVYTAALDDALLHGVEEYLKWRWHL